jgi:hypothetical protein
MQYNRIVLVSSYCMIRERNPEFVTPADRFYAISDIRDP